MTICRRSMVLGEAQFGTLWHPPDDLQGFPGDGERVPTGTLWHPLAPSGTLWHLPKMRVIPRRRNAVRPDELSGWWNAAAQPGRDKGIANRRLLPSPAGRQKDRREDEGDQEQRTDRHPQPDPRSPHRRRRIEWRPGRRGDDLVQRTGRRLA